MPTPFVLELREISSLTEARFAAGEGFTHIRLQPELAQGPPATIQEIKNFLSGIKVGIDLEDGSAKPDWADYHADKLNLYDSDDTYSLVPPGSEGDQKHTIIEIEDLTKDVPQGFGHPKGISLPSAAEYKTGHADFEPVQEFLEKARQYYGL